MNNKNVLVKLFNSCSQEQKEETYKIHGCSQQNFNWILRTATKESMILKAINSLKQVIKKTKEETTQKAIDKNQVIEEICKQVEEGVSLWEVLLKSKMPSRSTFYKWMNGDKEKLQQYVRAQETREKLIFESKNIMLE